MYPEILAPAGSVESLYAAVNAGCDAVYMGGARFGARAYADNPDCENLLSAINYCHIHGVKLYMTVNTLLKDSEVKCLYKYIKPYYEIGLDAVIVQDMGVLSLLHKYFPDLKLHASTQMALTTGYSADILKKYGVTRIIPARELTISEIKQIRNTTDIEIEVFVHGALCYCYSGQCLFSSMLGTRSGNRGRCTQPCRLPYFIDNKGNKSQSYILSMKELCTLPYIGELIEAGVSSFKIEGRMKRPVYTAFVTSIYRKYVNLYKELGKSSYKRYIEDNKEEFLYDIDMLAEVYNREGFTCGYLSGKKEDMLASMRPNHGGVCVGQVVGKNKGTFKYKLFKDINAHDVVETRDGSMKSGYEYTTGSDRKAGEIVEAKFKKGCIINKKDKVYRTKNATLLDDIKSRYIDNNKKVIITGIFKAACGEKPCLFVKNAAGIEAVVYGDICQRAQKSAATKAAVEKSILQTKDTEFEFGRLEVLIDSDLFLPVSQLKNMRRLALNKLRDNIIDSYLRKSLYTPCNIEQYNNKTITPLVYKASIMTMSQLDAVLNSINNIKISEIYIKTELLEEENIREAFLKVKSSGMRCCIVMPHIFRHSTWEYEKKCVENGSSIYGMQWDGYIIKNFEEYVFLTEIVGIDSGNIITDSGLYIMNSSSSMFWKELGVTKHTMPFELEISEMKDIAKVSNMEAVIYTHVPLMVSAQCTVCNMKGCKKDFGTDISSTIIYDLDGKEFTVVNYCKYCYNVIYQKEPISVINCTNKLSDIGISGFRYDFTIERAEEVKKILSGKYSKRTNTGHYFDRVK